MIGVPNDLAGVKRLMEPCVLAPAHLHQSGSTHGSLSPDTTCVQADGRVVLERQESRAAGDTVEGPDRSNDAPEVRYLAPEQIEGGRADARTDIFAVGTLAYELLTGEEPFRGDDVFEVAFKHVHKVPAPVSATVCTIPEEWDRLVGRCLEKDMDDRYPSAAHLLYDLKRLSVTPVSPRDTRETWAVHETADVFEPERILEGEIERVTGASGEGSEESRVRRDPVMRDELHLLLQRVEGGETSFQCAWRPKDALTPERLVADEAMQREYAVVMAALNEPSQLGLLTFRTMSGASFETLTAFQMTEVSLTVAGQRVVE